MMKRTAHALLAVALVTGLGACSATTGRTAGRNIDDAGITASVKSKLASDSARTLTSVDVDTVSGTVYLTGTVPDARTKERAGSIARDVGGVRRVVNNLQTRAAAAGDAPSSSERRLERDYE